jgi:hypothetical protein
MKCKLGGGPLIRIEIAPDGRVHVIGALELSVVETLIEASAGREATLDLSQVYTADSAAVRGLAELPSERFRLLAAPSWLEVWIEYERRLLAARPSRIHDEPRTPGSASSGDSPPFLAFRRGHGRCTTDRNDDPEETK